MCAAARSGCATARVVGDVGRGAVVGGVVAVVGAGLIGGIGDVVDEVLVDDPLLHAASTSAPRAQAQIAGPDLLARRTSDRGPEIGAA
jgi:hypothetical protein